MDAPMVGVVATVFAALLSQRSGWDLGRSRGMLALAGLAFSVAIVLPSIAIKIDHSNRREDVLVAAGIATGLGALLLVWGVVLFVRRV